MSPRLRPPNCPGTAPTINMAYLNLTLLNYDSKTHALKARPQAAGRAGRGFCAA
jgi:hypothetical protein